MILLIHFFAHVLAEVQFLGHKFALKGSTYTRENTVSGNTLVDKLGWVNLCVPLATKCLSYRHYFNLMLIFRLV